MRNRPTLFALALTLVAGVAVHRAAAQTVNVNPVADAFVTTGPSNNLSGNNYGGGGNLAVSAPGSTKGEFQTVMKFDLSAAKAAFDAQYGAGVWSIQSITLQLTANNPANNAIFNPQAAGQFQVSWMHNDSWVEGTGNPNAPTADGITFNSLSSFLGPNDQALGTFSVGTAITGANVYNLNLASGLTSDVSGGGLLSLRLFAADSSVSYLFNSRTFGTASARPILTVNVVPEPSSCVLAVGGIAVLGCLKFRRK